MADQADVLIIGGGVIGLTTAYFLAREGVAVRLLDQAPLGPQASWAGAGIIPPGDPERAHTPFDQLRARSAAMYPSLSQELREGTGIDNGYLVSGGLEFESPTGEQAEASEEWRGEGIVFRELDGPALRQLEPALSPALTHGYHLPTMAQVRNPRHLKALTAACAKRGVRLQQDCAVLGLVRQGSHVEAVETDEERIVANRYLLAAGARTEGLLQPLGWWPGIRPVRGQIALLNTDRPGPRPILVQGKRYLVPRGDGRILVGSTEEDAGFDARPTAGAIAELLEFAAALVPSLAAASVERCWAGLRPGSPDGLPYLGAVPGFSNLFIAAGHFRAGIQLSPATALVMRELLLGQTPSIPLEPFRLDRPLPPPVQTAFRS
jgi:glycine oxidase